MNSKNIVVNYWNNQSQMHWLVAFMRIDTQADGLPQLKVVPIGYMR